jgi:thioredoxin-related protein
MACIQAKPIVDGIEQDFAGQLTVLRVDAQSQTGQALARQMQMLFTPTFIFFDTQGSEAWRSVGRIDPQKVKDSLQ